MPYYQGDPYGMARGDPGFFSFIRGAVGLGGGLMKRVLGLGGRAAPSTAMMRIPQGAMTRIGQAGQAVAGMVRRRPGVAGAIAGTAAGAGMAGIAAEVLGGGGRAARAGRMAGMGRRRRRMHVTNMKALRRAIRRAHGFAKIARRVLHFVSPKPPKGRPLFKHRRKKSL